MAAAEVRDAVERHPEVEAAYTVAGEASAIVHVRARDTAHLEEALERLRDRPGVTRTQTQIVLSTLFERPFDEHGAAPSTTYELTRTCRPCRWPRCTARATLGVLRRASRVLDRLPRKPGAVIVTVILVPTGTFFFLNGWRR